MTHELPPASVLLSLIKARVPEPRWVGCNPEPREPRLACPNRDPHSGSGQALFPSTVATANDPLPFVSKSFRAITARQFEGSDDLTVSQGYTAYGAPET